MLREYYTREEIKHLMGIDLWREDCVYEPITIDLRTVENFWKFQKMADEGPESYIDVMVDRLELGGGLAAIIIEDNGVTDGTHRTIAYFKAKQFIVNALKRVPIQKYIP